MLRRTIRLFALTAALAMIAFPASSAAPPRSFGASPFLARVSQIAAVRHFLAHPEDAPPQLAPRFAEAAEATAVSVRSAAAAEQASLLADRFNLDDVGLPQNEEAVTVCERNVLSATNDYRGLLDPQGNFTGWHLSTDGGATVQKEGLLPPVAGREGPLPSGGDPVVQSVSTPRCIFYAASLNTGPDPFTEGQNGIGLYRTTIRRLRQCPAGEDPDGLTNPACWPTRRLVATADVFGSVGQFLDKEWFDVGRSGDAGRVVWVAYADFAVDVDAPLGFTGAQIKAVRCDEFLQTCTDPILISGTDEDIQFADVTISDTGRTIISWVQIEGELEQTAQTFTVKLRVAPPGSTTFGPTRTVAVETNPLPFGGFLHANDFRTATYPKVIAPLIGGDERIFVTWDRCRFRLFDSVCEEPEIVLTHSDDLGRTWAPQRTVSAGGDNYFPAITDERGTRDFAMAWFTNRFDPMFHNRVDVEMILVNSRTGAVVHRQRVTSLSNESEADPILGGFFIGDYIDVHLRRGLAYVAYNANYRKIRVLGEGFPIPQQDNYLTIVRTT
jgi:hypothetical protein